MRILVVEDDPIIALHIADELQAAGASVVGPAHRLADALTLADEPGLAAAVLDFRLEHGDSAAIAERLISRGVPFVFQTSDRQAIPEALRNAVTLDKPIIGPRLVRALEEVVAESQRRGHARDPAERAVAPPARHHSDDDGVEFRIRQQELLAALGVSALQRKPLQELLQDAAEVAAEGMRAEFSKVLEFEPDTNRFRLRAGVGWDPGVVGSATIGADLESPAGFAVRTGRPVISNHLEHEHRFRTPQLLMEHGVRRAMNVILQGEGKPFGVLEVDSRSQHEFGERDLSFLQGAANVLGMAIERERHDEKMRGVMEYQAVLIKEINHRVKNSLQLVASLLELQAHGPGSAPAAPLLHEAVARIRAVARAHERLYRGTDVARIDLAEYIGDVCADLAEFAGKCRLDCRRDARLPISTDRAVRIALLVTELVTNAAKHAFPGEEKGDIVVQIGLESADTVVVSVADDGKGLPADFDLESSRGLGMRFVRALVAQLEGTMAVHRLAPGTRFEIRIAREANGAS